MESTAPSSAPAADRVAADSLAARRAVLVAGGWYAAFLGLHVLLAWDNGSIVSASIPGIGGWLGPFNWAVYAVFAVLAAGVTGWRATGIARLPAAGWLRICAPPVLAGLPFLLFGWNLDASSVVPLLLVGLPLVALNEELFFRGVLLHVLVPLGVRRSMLWSALAFGFAHLPNVLSGAYPPFVAMQIAATTAGGITLAAIRLRSGSLWPVLLVHLAIDAMAVPTLTGSATSSPLLLPVLFAWLGANLLLWGYGWRLVRKVEDEPGWRPSRSAGV